MSLFKKKTETPDITKLVANYTGDIKLNIGCGTDYKEGWINVDNNSDENIEDGKLDLDWDLRNPLPFADNSIDYVFNEHFFEHLSVEEAQPVMQDLMRVLKPGGVMRIAMPDLEWVVDNYINQPVETDPVIKKYNLEGVKTKAEWINMSFRWWGHKWLYDWEELQRRLSESGFDNVKRCKLRESEHEALCGLEIRDESFLIAEVTK